MLEQQSEQHPEQRLAQNHLEAHLEATMRVLCRHKLLRAWAGGEDIGVEEFAATAGALPLLARYVARLDEAMGTRFAEGITIERDDGGLFGERVHVGRQANMLPLVIMFDTALDTGLWLTEQHELQAGATPRTDGQSGGKAAGQTDEQADEQADEQTTGQAFDLDVFHTVLEKVNYAFAIPSRHAGSQVSTASANSGTGSGTGSGTSPGQ